MSAVQIVRTPEERFADLPGYIPSPHTLSPRLADLGRRAVPLI
jgi:hypothetical protein